MAQITALDVIQVTDLFRYTVLLMATLVFSFTLTELQSRRAKARPMSARPWYLLSTAAFGAASLIVIVERIHQEPILHHLALTTVGLIFAVIGVASHLRSLRSDGDRPRSKPPTR